RDKVIVNTAEILRSNTKYNDIVAKFSEDEFCIILKHTNEDNVNETLELLVNEVKNAPLHVDGNKVIKSTISIGASMNNYDTFDEILEQADMMLFNAKQDGGNQVLFS
ncbi:GGDEF domain-containing protein, partial [Sulfurimonas sp.]|nr:GGDEF domain-containing protein [Sulfurimonas sp.]